VACCAALFAIPFPLSSYGSSAVCGWSGASALTSSPRTTHMMQTGQIRITLSGLLDYKLLEKEAKVFLSCLSPAHKANHHTYFPCRSSRANCAWPGQMERCCTASLWSGWLVWPTQPPMSSKSRCTRYLSQLSCVVRAAIQFRSSAEPRPLPTSMHDFS